MVYISRRFDWDFESNDKIEECCSIILNRQENTPQQTNKPKQSVNNSKNNSVKEITINFERKKTFTPTSKSNKSNKHQKRRKQFNVIY